MVFKNLAKDSLIYGGADFATKVFAFFCFPIIASIISTTNFGIMELLNTSIGLFGLFINSGLNNATQRFYWDPKVDILSQPSIVTSGFFTQVFLSLIFLFFGILLIPFFIPLLNYYHLPLDYKTFIYLLIIIGFTQLNQFILDVIRLHFKPILFLLLSLLTRVLGLGLGIYFLIENKSGLDDFYAPQAFILFITVPFGLWIIRKDFQINSIDFKVVKKLLKFGYPFIFVGLAYWLFGMIDRWMLALMTTTENVGLFSIAYRFSSILFFVSTAFGQAWSPVSMKIMRDYPNNYRKIYGDVLIVLICILLFFAIILSIFSGEIITLLMPFKYIQSAAPLIVLSFAILIQATLQITAIGISIEKKTHLFVRLTWTAAFFNLILNWILINSLGLIGSAYATLISNIFLTVSYFYFTQKLHPIIIPKNKLVILFLIAISCMFVSLFMVNTNFIFNIMIIKIAIVSILLFITASTLPFNIIKVFNKK